MNDDNFPAFVLLPFGLCVVFFLLGTLAGQGMGKDEVTRETIVYCVEKPADCKVKYDYYKLEIKNDRTEIRRQTTARHY